MTPFIAELTGTTVLIALGAGVVANVLLHGTKGNSSGLIVIASKEFKNDVEYVLFVSRLCCREFNTRTRIDASPTETFWSNV